MTNIITPVNSVTIPKVSVTVPIYNAIPYLEKCLSSLANQTLKNIEFILVNDGSTDQSGKLCEEYTKRDSRFHVIHQENAGSAAARQTALDKAKGEYVIVCDSDDWVEPEMYEHLYNEAIRTDADIVICGYYTEYNDGRSVIVKNLLREKNGLIDNDDLIRYGAGSSWVKLIRRSLFHKAKANYTRNINLGEDILIMYKLRKANPKIVQLRENLYHYRRLFGINSYTNNIRMTQILQLDYIYEWLKANYPEEKYADLRYQSALNIAFACLRTQDLDKKYLDCFLHKELKWQYLFTNPLSSKGLVAMFEKLFPLALTKNIVKILYPILYK